MQIDTRPRRGDSPVAPHLPLAGSGEVVAPQGGVVTSAVAPGAMVAAGQPIAHVADPVMRLRLAVKGPNPGMVFRQDLWPTCLRGQGLGHLAGAAIVRHGDLLAD